MKKNKMTERERMVSHHNCITESIFQMNAIQINIFTTLIFKTKNANGKIKLSSKEIKQLCSKDQSNKSFKENLEGLQDKVFKFSDGNIYKSIVPFPTLEFNIKEGTVEVRVNQDIEPYLKNLKQEFTKYSLSEFISIKGIYAKRIYQLIKQYTSVKQREIPLLQLKEMLNVQDVKTYQKFTKFEDKILIKSVEEITKKTSLNVVFEKVKVGNKIRKIIFHFEEKLNKIDNEKNNVIDNKKDIISSNKNLKNPQLKLTILKIKENEFISNSWNKRVDTKILKMMSENDEKYVVKILEKLSEIVTEKTEKTLVSLINEIIKNDE